MSDNQISMFAKHIPSKPLSNKFSTESIIEYKNNGSPYLKFGKYQALALELYPVEYVESLVFYNTRVSLADKKAILVLRPDVLAKEVLAVIPAPLSPSHWERRLTRAYDESDEMADVGAVESLLGSMSPPSAFSFPSPPSKVSSEPCSLSKKKV